MNPNPPHACARCHHPLVAAGPNGEAQCLTCAPTPDHGAGISPKVMAQLSTYWERRLMEGREKDWT